MRRLCAVLWTINDCLGGVASGRKSWPHSILKTLLVRRSENHYKTSSRTVRRGMPWQFFKRKSGIFLKELPVLAGLSPLPYLIGENANAQDENKKWREKTLQTYLKG